MVLSIMLAGCATRQPKTRLDTAGGVPYVGPKARLTVADFEVKAAKATIEIGSGLREMLVTALVNSSRFSVIEHQAPAAVTPAQEPAVADTAQNNAASVARKAKAADVIVAVTITEFEPVASGGSGGIGGGGGVNSGALGGLLGVALNKAHMALDIRLIDASTSETLAATHVQGQASDVSGGFMAGFPGSWGLGKGLVGYANTPMEKAIRICIIEAVRYISQVIPVGYYKY